MGRKVSLVLALVILHRAQVVWMGPLPYLMQDFGGWDLALEALEEWKWLLLPF